MRPGDAPWFLLAIVALGLLVVNTVRHPVLGLAAIALAVAYIAARATFRTKRGWDDD